MASRIKNKLSEIMTRLSVMMMTMMMMATTPAYAQAAAGGGNSGGGGGNINLPQVNMANDFNKDPATIVISLSLYVARIIGAGLVIWGIVGFVTARKEGDAGAITSEIGKLAGGLLLIFMPALLKAIGLTT